MSNYQQKAAICAKKQECITQSLEKQNKRNFPWGSPGIGFTIKDFKSVILNLLNELKGTIEQQLKETMKMMSKQVENITKEIENIKINKIEILEWKLSILEKTNSLVEVIQIKRWPRYSMWILNNKIKWMGEGHGMKEAEGGVMWPIAKEGCHL